MHRSESPMMRRLRQLDLDRQYTAGTLVRHLLIALCVIYTVTSAAVAILDWWALVTMLDAAAGVDKHGAPLACAPVTEVAR